MPIDDLSAKKKDIIVPQLPVPNVHAHNAVWPNDMSSLITYKGSSAFYVAKGIKPLNFELTWRQASFP